MKRFCALYIALTAIIVHLQDGGIWSLANDLNPVCNTVECQRLGKFYEQNIDTLGDPCMDFYDYVCSNWGMHNSRPKELYIQYLWNVDHSLELRSLQEMRKLLETKAPSTSSEFQQAKLLYKTCMSIPYMERSSPGNVWNVTRKASPFPLLLPKNTVLSERPFLWELDRLYIQTAGESALYDFYPVYETSTKEIITNLLYPPTGYGSLIRPLGWSNPNEREHYRSFLTKIIRSVAEPSINISKEVMENDINAVIEFREKLNTIVAKLGSIEKTEIMTIQKFQKWYSSNASSNPTADINWLNTIRAMYQKSDGPPNFSITETSKIKVDTIYFSKLAALLGETNKRTVANHIHLFFLENHVERTSAMKIDLAGSVAGCGLWGVITSETPRWKKCIETNNLKTAIGKAYVSSFFPPAVKAEVAELFETMKKLMGTQILQSTWVDNATKAISINKLKGVEGALGYPDWYDATAPTKPTLVEMNPIQPLVLYMHEFNRVVFSAAALQWPIHSTNVPYVIDYGSLASQMGHELYQAFDGQGIKHNANGKPPFWSKKMIAKYYSNAECFTEQMENYKQKEVRELTINSVYTTEDDISSMMGLKLAYIGYKKMMEKKNGVCPVLPGFKKFSCDQLFFIAFANNHCSASLPGYNELVWFTNGQNMPKIKVNGAVANMKEFSTAFRCRPNALLNLNHTCDLWRP